MVELRVGSRELKARLGRYVRVAREGGSVTITEWGKPVARLVPLRDSDAEPPIEERVEALVRRGKLLRGTGARPRARQPQVSLADGEMLSDLIVAERDSHPVATLGGTPASDPLP